MADLTGSTFADIFPKLLQDPGDGTIQKSDGTEGASGKADLTGGNTFSGVQTFNDNVNLPVGTEIAERIVFNSFGAEGIIQPSSQRLGIWTDDASGTAVKRMVFDSGEDQSAVAFTDVNVGIGGSPNALLDVSGNIHTDGISFDGGANVLGEYKEGISWTPVHVDTPTTNPAVGGGTAPTFTGDYWIVGKLLFGLIVIDFDDTASVNVNDRWEITGLPKSSVGGTLTHVGGFNVFDGFAAGRMGYGAMLTNDENDSLYMQVNNVTGSLDYTSKIRGYFSYIIT